MTDGKRKLSKFGDIFDRPPPKCNAPHPCHICSPPEKDALDCKLEAHDAESEANINKEKFEFHLHQVSTRRESKGTNTHITAQNGCSERTIPEKQESPVSNIPNTRQVSPPYLPKFSCAWQMTKSHINGPEETISLSSDVRVVFPVLSIERNETLNVACAVSNNIVDLHHTLKLPPEASIIAPLIEVYVDTSSGHTGILKVTLPTSETSDNVKVVFFDITDEHDPPLLSEVNSKSLSPSTTLYYTFQDDHTLCVHTGVSCGIVCIKYGRRRRKMLCSLTGELYHLYNDAEIILRLYMYHDELITGSSQQDKSIMLGKPLISNVFLPIDFDDIISKDSGLLSVVTIILCIEKQFENLWCHRCNEHAEPMYPGLLDVCLADVLEKLNGDACVPFEIKWCLLQCHENSLEGLAGSIEIEFLTLHKPPKTTRMTFQLTNRDLVGLVVD